MSFRKSCGGIVVWRRGPVIAVTCDRNGTAPRGVLLTCQTARTSTILFVNQKNMK